MAIRLPGGVRSFAQRCGARQRLQQAQQRLTVARRQAIARQPACVEVDLGSDMHRHAYLSCCSASHKVDLAGTYMQMQT
jgi:hypothetical protein